MGDMRQSNKRHGNRVMEDMVQGNKRHGNRVIRGSSEIWSDKLKVLYNWHTERRSDGGNAMSRRCRRHKERRRYSVQILDNYFEVNALYINC